jgi:hypothetical protein
MDISVAQRAVQQKLGKNRSYSLIGQLVKMGIV